MRLFDEAFARKFDFDVLDATKLIPEEILPLRVIGRMVLDQNPTNVFAQTEQVEFCTSHEVPEVDFTNAPLLQGRNLSYIDTQITRLRGANFAQIPINPPRVPVQNFQRDGHMQMGLQRGGVSYEPSMLGRRTPREDPTGGYRSFPAREEGDKMRVRAESFAVHCKQARQCFDSQTVPEQNHIVAAITFELSKVEPKIAQRIAEGLGYRDPIKGCGHDQASADRPQAVAGVEHPVQSEAHPHGTDGRLVGPTNEDA